MVAFTNFGSLFPLLLEEKWGSENLTQFMAYSHLPLVGSTRKSHIVHDLSTSSLGKIHQAARSHKVYPFKKVFLEFLLDGFSEVFDVFLQSFKSSTPEGLPVETWAESCQKCVCSTSWEVLGLLFHEYSLVTNS